MYENIKPTMFIFKHTCTNEPHTTINNTVYHMALEECVVNMRKQERSSDVDPKFS